MCCVCKCNSLLLNMLAHLRCVRIIYIFLIIGGCTLIISWALRPITNAPMLRASRKMYRQFVPNNTKCYFNLCHFFLLSLYIQTHTRMYLH